MTYYFLVSLPADRSQLHQASGAASSLALQAQCAEAAANAYVAEGYGPADRSGDVTSYVDHYDQKLNKCFIEISDSSSALREITLIDAYGLQQYADLLIFFAPRYNNGGSNPVCDVDEQISDVSARAACNSQADFDAYVNPYMTD